MSNTDQSTLRTHTRKALHRLRHRDPLAELMNQTRLQLEHELTEVDNALHIAQVEHSAAQLRYRQAVAIAVERRAHLRRQLAVLSPNNREEAR